MLTYTNHLEKLKLPEYGRSIQKMVDHCLTIEDRAERTRCSFAIVQAMTALFPNTSSDKEAYNRKLWDHLYIMSDFKLDVDGPYEPVGASTFEGRPDPLPIPGRSAITFRHYGKITEELIEKAAAMSEGPERTELVYQTACQMKKQRCAIDRETDDERIFNDLHYLSKGVINVPRGAMILPDYRVMAQQGQASGKKKKRK